MKIIVGLGNPGKEYQESRHNIGFRTVNYLNKEFGGSLAGEFDLDKKSNSELSEVKINGKKVLLVKPQMFVNRSGEVVKKLVAKSKGIADLIVIHDDLDIPFGKIKLSFGRSSAGHKGVESIIKALKTDKFHRIRFGTFNSQLIKIRRIKDKRKRLSQMNKFVISPFGPGEKPKLNKLIKEAVEKLLQL